MICQHNNFTETTNHNFIKHYYTELGYTILMYIFQRNFTPVEIMTLLIREFGEIIMLNLFINVHVFCTI